MPILNSTAYQTARTVTALVRSILNDAGTLSIPVVITSITRANATGVVTVTTLTPHNMVTGDYAVIGGVPTTVSNFNGTFQLTGSTPSSNQFTYAQAGVNDTQTSGQVQGQGIGAIFTDSILMPFVNAAYQTVGSKLENLSSGTFIQETLLVVPAVAEVDPSVQVVINDATAAPNQLPTNLLFPLKIQERLSGSSDDFQDMTNLTDHGGLPSREQGEVLESWEWRADGLYFVGATVAVQIRLRYMSFFADLTDGTSTLLIRNMREAIAYGAVILAASSRGVPIQPIWTQLAEDRMEDVLNAAARTMQRTNFRMRGYSRRRGMGWY
jgi:hypothetical protein